MRRVHIAIGAVVVIAGFVLFYIVRTDSKEETSRSAVKGEAKSAAPDDSKTTQAPPRDPELPDDPSAHTRDAVDGGGNEFETVNKDGSRVRDYRGRDIQRDPDAKVRVPLKTLKIEPGLMSKLGIKLRAVAKRCKKEHAGDVPRNSRVQPRVTFSVSEDRLTVDETELSLINVREDSGFKACMRSAIIGLSLDAPEHAAIASHQMAVPINLDRL